MLPKLPDLNGKQDTRNKAAVLRTGTDDLPVESNKISYRKLTGENYFHRNELASNGTAQVSATDQIAPEGADCNLLQTGQLGSGLHGVSSGDTDEKSNTAGWTIIEPRF